MNFKKLLLSFSIVFTVLPCMASGNDFMDKAISSWYGYSLDSFIKLWGYPDRQSVLAGHNLYYWDIIKVIRTNYNSYTNSSNSYENYCSVIIEADSESIIRNGQYKGSDCPISYLLNAEKYVNPQNDPWKIEKELKQQKRQNAKLNKNK